MLSDDALGGWWRTAALMVFPGLRGASHQQLAQHARERAGLAACGHPIQIPQDGLALLYGHTVPHQRGRLQAGVHIGIASLCYAAQRP